MKSLWMQTKYSTPCFCLVIRLWFSNAKPYPWETIGWTMSSARTDDGKARVSASQAQMERKRFLLKKERERERNEWPRWGSRKEEGSPWWSGYESRSVLKWLKSACVDIGRKMTGKWGISFWEQTVLHVRMNSSKELQVHSPGFHCSLETSLLFLWGNILLLKNSFTELPK